MQTDSRRLASPLERMRALVYQLCSPSCGGRAPGTREGEAARAVLIAALEQAGIAPAGPVGYAQPVPGCSGANLLGKVAEARGDRYILIGAHYDHLGWHTPSREAYWGADDNAAAVAIAMEVARALAERPDGLSRQVLLCLFDGEEPPFFLTRGMGSEHWARHPTVPLDRIDLMLCMDLVGHSLGQEGHPAALRQALFVLGAEKSMGTAALCDGLAAPGLTPMRLGIDLLPPMSDYRPFQLRQVPFLFLTCGRWRHYHQVTDTPDRLDYGKMTAIAAWVETAVRATAARPERPVVYLPDGRDDARTLNMLWSGLSLLAPWSSIGRDGLRVVEKLIHAARGRDLDAREFEQAKMVAMQLEVQLS